MITTSYGTWTTIEPCSVSLEDTVSAALGDFVAEYDYAAIAKEYREAINEALPLGVVLAGQEFIGPYPRQEIPLREIVLGVDLHSIVERHALTDSRGDS